MARMTADLVATLHDRVSLPARQIGRSLDHVERQGHRAQRGLDRSVPIVGRTGGALSLLAAQAGAVAAPLAAAYGGSAIVRSAADFETSLTNIQKKAGSSAAETARLGEEIKALATSGELAVSIDELAAAYERGAAAGIPLNELRDFASLSAKAADAFEMSATDVGNASAGFNTVLGIPLDRMERYFDLINGLADSGIADESDIVRFVDQAGAMAKTFGFSADETAALGSSLANLKVNAAKGATAMNAIFTRLMAPDALSSDGRAAYDHLIKDDKRFKKQLASGNADEAFVEVIDALRAMGKEERTGVIVELFGQDHLDVMTQLVEGADELKRNLRYAGDETQWLDSLDRSYRLKLDDFWSRWQVFKNQIEMAAIDVGTFGMPLAIAGIERARDLIDTIRSGVSDIQMQVDWSAVSQARRAVADMLDDVSRLLGIDASESDFAKSMSDIAKMIGQVASVVKSVSREMGDVSEFLEDPTGYLSKERSDQWYKDRGITINRELLDARRVADERENRLADDARERSMADFERGDGLVSPDPNRPTPEPRRADDPYFAVPSAGIRIGPFTPDDAARERADKRWAEIQTEHAERERRQRTPRRPISLTPRRVGPVDPAEKVDPATMRRLLDDLRSDLDASSEPSRAERFNTVAHSARLRPDAVSRSAAVQPEIRKIDQQLREMQSRAEQIMDGAALAPISGGAAALGQLADQMEELMRRRDELDAKLQKPFAQAPVPGIAAPIEGEISRAALAADAGGRSMQASLSFTARPTVDASSIHAALRDAEALNRALARTPGLAQSASAHAQSARIDYSGLHADLSRAG